MKLDKSDKNLIVVAIIAAILIGLSFFASMKYKTTTEIKHEHNQVPD